MFVRGRNWTIGNALQQASPAAELTFTSGGQLASMIKRLANFGPVARIAHLN
jgi:hypothetical protein